MAQHPHRKIPDSEIRLENIIPGSPKYVPYRRVPKNTKSGKVISCTSVDMIRSKKTMSKAQMAKLNRELQLATQAKQKECQTKGSGKVSHKKLQTKAPHKMTTKQKPR